MQTAIICVTITLCVFLVCDTYKEVQQIKAEFWDSMNNECDYEEDIEESEENEQC